MHFISSLRSKLNEHTLNTDASKRSLPDERLSLGLSRLSVLKRPSEERKSGIPACTEIPAPIPNSI